MGKTNSNEILRISHHWCEEICISNELAMATEWGLLVTGVTKTKTFFVRWVMKYFKEIFLLFYLPFLAHTLPVTIVEKTTRE